ncbi:uncharacterized protein LOC143296275 [Babylonia areolata]|uniref:uncharacterized protein LOC143296275 n=1 Tax=Babylonia areolata TaxID=304850 RepID=UPI003FD66993
MNTHRPAREQQQLCASRCRHDSTSSLQEESFLPPPPPYHEAVQSFQAYPSGGGETLWATSDDHQGLYMDEVDGHHPHPYTFPSLEAPLYPSSTPLYPSLPLLPPDLEVTTVFSSTATGSATPSSPGTGGEGEGPSPVVGSYPSRPHSNNFPPPSPDQAEDMSFLDDGFGGGLVGPSSAAAAGGGWVEGWSPGVSYPARPLSNPGEVPGCPLSVPDTGCGEYSLYYSLETTPTTTTPTTTTSLTPGPSSLSGLDFPGWPSVHPSPPPPPPAHPPRPLSTVSVLSYLEDYGDIGAVVEGCVEESQVKGVAEGVTPQVEEEEKGEGGPEAWERPRSGISPGGVLVEQEAQRTDAMEENRKLLQDVRDDELLACARQVVERGDPSLLTKMMLKTKLQLDYVNKGQAVPDVSAFPSKRDSHQLRPDEEEKVARRKRNGCISAKVYRDKQKRLKQDKETTLKELEEKNRELKEEERSLKQQIADIRQWAAQNNLLTPSTTPTTVTTTTDT